MLKLPKTIEKEMKVHFKMLDQLVKKTLTLDQRLEKLELQLINMRQIMNGAITKKDVEKLLRTANGIKI
jgi:hypothetical protein